MGEHVRPRLYSDLQWIWPLLSPKEDYKEEAETIVQEFHKLGAVDGSRMLHLGSGGGSLDFHLKRNFEITGVDISGPMRRFAGSINPEVEYLDGDIRTARIGAFDVVMLHDAIAYMTTEADLYAAYETIAANLRPGGAFVSMPEQVLEGFRQDRVHGQTHRDDTTSVTTVEVSHDPDPNDTNYETTFIYLIRRAGYLEIETDVHTIGVYPLATFIEAAEAAGLSAEVVNVKLSDMDEFWRLVLGTKPA
jgi:hypothetical protein